MEVPKTIFRNYDIRGVYPQEINEEIALHIGRALGSVLVKRGKKNVVVGRDDRASSPSLSASLIKGLLTTGCDVIDVGITLTPVIHFLTVTEDFDMGIVVTASHNPKEFNGFRVDYKNARSFYGDLILMIRFIIEREAYEYGEGKLSRVDLTQKYIEFLTKKFKFKKEHKIVVDCGSGASSELAPVLFEKLGCKVMPVYCKYDSNFPRGVPDPENTVYMKELSEQVLENKADVGFAYDTDGDRMGVVDEKGVSYDTDQLLMLFSEYVLKKNPQATVVYDVKSSSQVEHVIRKYKGVPKLLRTGHPYFGDAVQDYATLGAEYSGHVYFSDDYFGYDDGVYASCRVLQILDKEKKTLSQLMAEYPKTSSTNELKVDCPDALKFKVINMVKIFVMNEIKYKKMVDIDGVRVNVTDSGWFLIRASNTSPYLSVRVEGKDEKEKQEILNIVQSALDSVSMVDLKLKV